MPEETKAHTEQPGGEREPFPPFQSQNFPSQLFWLTVTFVALYLLMSRLALPRIGAILEQRRQHIADDLGEAQRLKSESESTLAAYEKALADARARAQAIAGETHQRLAAEGEERRKTLEAELNARLAEAEETIAATKADAMANVRDIAIDAAGTIIERLIGSSAPPAAVTAAVDAVLKS
jgi:F-type H+-transporting ATPase subunit b